MGSIFKQERLRVDRLIDPVAVEAKAFDRQYGANLDAVAERIVKLFDDDGITSARVTQSEGKERRVVVSGGGSDLFSVRVFIMDHHGQKDAALLGESIADGEYEMLDGHHYPKVSSAKQRDEWVEDVLGEMLKQVVKREPVK